MTVEKLSISMPSNLVETIRSCASEAGVSLSGWLAQAAQLKADEDRRLAEGRRASAEAIAEVEAESGAPIPPEVWRQAEEAVRRMKGAAAGRRQAS